MHVDPPKVVIVGRTNVGKSTLFNRLIEKNKSLVSNIPGTTRDRFEADCIWRAQVVRMVDTGGLDRETVDEIEEQIATQARLAIEQADVLLFVVDLQAGLQEEDRLLAKELVKAKQPVIVVGNKADNLDMMAGAHEKEWHNWPLDAPMPISAARGTGTGDLLDEVYDELNRIGQPPVSISDIAATMVAVVGRPNVGKSSLLNAALGQNRFITSDRAHTTREPNDTHITVDGRDYILIDTAGIRKMGRIYKGKSKLEITGVERSKRAAQKAHVILFVLDVSKRITGQDKHLAGMVEDSGASVIIIANKWDLIPDKETNTINEYEEYIRAHLPQLDWAPIVFTSAHTGKRVPHVFDVIDHVFQNRFTQLDNLEAKTFISRAIARHKPSRGKGVAHPQIKSFVQEGVNPPSFALRINQRRIDTLNVSYLRFLENLLRKFYSFDGTPIRIKVIAKKKSHTTGAPIQSNKPKGHGTYRGAR